jgi:prolyl-tRNA editing enzyme YbaK/EbsC (Cys-tRNA(Pro) deacylase)
MWPDPVRRVADFLRTANAEARIEEFPDGTPTAEAAARAVGAPASQIVKSLLFVCDGRPVLTLVPGDRRADSEKVARAAGATEVRVARREEVVAATGFEPGAVAPFPHPGIHLVMVDRSLLAHEQVWVGAGSDRHLACVRPGELLRLTNGRQMDVVATPAYHSG